MIRARSGSGRRRCCRKTLSLRCGPSADGEASGRSRPQWPGIRNQSRLQLLIDNHYRLLDSRCKATLDALRIAASNMFAALAARFRPPELARPRNWNTRSRWSRRLSRSFALHGGLPVLPGRSGGHDAVPAAVSSGPLYGNHSNDHVMLRQLFRADGFLHRDGQTVYVRLWLRGRFQDWQLRAFRRFLAEVSEELTRPCAHTGTQIRVTLLSTPPAW